MAGRNLLSAVTSSGGETHASRKRTLAAAGMVSLFAVIALLFAGGCGGGGSGNDNAGFGNTSGTVTGSPNLSGTWDLSGLSASGRSITCPTGTTNEVVNVLTVNNVEADRCYAGENIAFSGNTYTITYPAPRFLNLATESGTYSVSGGTLTLSRNRRGFDTNNDGVIADTEQTTVSPSQNVSGSLTVQNGIFSFSPQSADVSNDIIRAVDGSVVLKSFTKRAE